jgi:DNA-binding transcriptional regulator YhcF (GntR family)
MATRSEVEQRRNALKQWLRREFENRVVPVGTILPPVKVLAANHGLSVNIAHQTLRQLVAEGVLHTVPGVGTFLGPRQTVTSEFYLFLREAPTGSAEQAIQAGFEEQIARQGGASLALTLAQAQELEGGKRLPALAGLYGVTGNRADGWRWAGAQDIPQVSFAGHEVDDFADLVSYNDFQGGRQAAEHLLQGGHRRIAFLGLHTPGAVSGPLRWSELREAGWHQAMAGAGAATEGLAFHPAGTAADTEWMHRAPQMARETARLLVYREDVTAVVAVNDNAARGLLTALQSAGRPRETWPSIVGFDNQEMPGGYWLTSLHLPADDLGRTAADLLWQRRHGLLTGPPVHRQTAMCLLPRLSSQTGWAARLSETVFL